MTRFWTLAALGAFFLVACDDTKVDDTGADDTGAGDGGAGDGGGGDTGDTGDVVAAPTYASVSWGSGALDLDVTADGPGGYSFGIVETSDTSTPWTGEDCWQGYELSDGSVLLYCHEVGPSGSLTLAYGGDPTALAEGSETVFTSAQEGSVTFYLWSDPARGGNDACWVWGNPSGYYDPLGCDEMFGVWGG